MRRALRFLPLLLCCALLPGCKPRDEAAPKAPEGKPHWEYASGPEGPQRTFTFYASLRSSNAPTGGAPASLLLLKHKGDTYADNNAPVIVLKNGRFHCTGGAGPCSVTMTVDAKAPQTVNGFDADCGASQCLMISAPAETGRTPQGEPLIEVLRHARTVVLELPLDRHGDFPYRFDTAGLAWSRQTDRQ